MLEFPFNKSSPHTEASTLSLRATADPSHPMRTGKLTDWLSTPYEDRQVDWLIEYTLWGQASWLIDWVHLIPKSHQNTPELYIFLHMYEAKVGTVIIGPLNNNNNLHNILKGLEEIRQNILFWQTSNVREDWEHEIGGVKHLWLGYFLKFNTNQLFFIHWWPQNLY